jgi:hypothetical protein
MVDFPIPNVTPQSVDEPWRRSRGPHWKSKIKRLIKAIRHILEVMGHRLNVTPLVSIQINDSEGYEKA